MTSESVSFRKIICETAKKICETAKHLRNALKSKDIHFFYTPQFFIWCQWVCFRKETFFVSATILSWWLICRGDIFGCRFLLQFWEKNRRWSKCIILLRIRSSLTMTRLLIFSYIYIIYTEYTNFMATGLTVGPGQSLELH